MQQSRVIPSPRSFACDLATLCAPTLAGLKPASLFRYQPAPGQDAAAMAAAALVQMLGGTPEQALDASSIALSNLLGLVCDPVGGLVEVPCQNRNAIGVAAAFSSAQLALAGIKSLVPFDQMAHVMLSVGHALPATLRETAKGGIAQAPAALSACAKCGVCG